MGVTRWSARWKAYQKHAPRAARSHPNLLVSAFLREQSKRLRIELRPGGSASQVVAKRLSRQLVRRYERQLDRVKGRKRRTLGNVDALLYQPKSDIVRDTLCPGFQQRWVNMARRLKNRTVREISLNDFSLSRNPQATMMALASLAEACTLFPDLKVNFLDNDCDDISPYIVLAHLTRALPPIISGGMITHEVGDVVEAVGMRRALRIGTIARRRRPKDYAVSAFKLVSRTPPGTFGDEDHLLRPQLKEYVADRFCDVMKYWLDSQELELTQEAEGSFVRAIGEALDNAERHGDVSSLVSEGDWSIAAFTKLHLHDGQPLLKCSLGIVSIGATISQSLGSAAPAVRTRIDEYVARHSPILATGTPPEALRTVMALQDGITRVEKATEGRRGGVGLMELTDVVAELGSTDCVERESAFTIVSGRTCIQIRNPHRKGAPNQDGLRELWFNAANDPGHPPSNDHVFTLDTEFPGVILSACFTIDPSYLRRNLEDESIADGQD